MCARIHTIEHDFYLFIFSPTHDDAVLETNSSNTDKHPPICVSRIFVSQMLSLFFRLVFERQIQRMEGLFPFVFSWK